MKGDLVPADITVAPRSTSEWAEFLAGRFKGTRYESTEYWSWCAAGVEEDDDPEDVAAAWIESCKQPAM
jgi:hypothetical protein